MQITYQESEGKKQTYRTKAALLNSDLYTVKSIPFKFDGF